MKTELTGHVQTGVVIGASMGPSRGVCTSSPHGAWGPLAIPSSVPSSRSPDTQGIGIKEKVEVTLTLPAEPEFLASEAGEKWKRPFR